MGENSSLQRRLLLLSMPCYPIVRNKMVSLVILEVNGRQRVGRTFSKRMKWKEEM